MSFETVAAPPREMDEDDIMQENAVLHAAHANRMFYHEIMTFMKSVVKKNSWWQLQNGNIPYYPIAAAYRYGKVVTLPYINFKGSDGKLFRILVYRDNDRHNKVVCVLLNATRYDELLRKAKKEQNPRWYQKEKWSLTDKQKMDFILSGGDVVHGHGSMPESWEPNQYDSIEDAVNDVFDVLDPMITNFEVTDSESDFTEIMCQSPGDV